MKIFNKTEYKQRRQALRSNMTEPEKRLWDILRNGQMGVKFRRQHGIGHYIADFYSHDLKLIIEVDGDTHFSPDAQEYDKERDAFMKALGIETIRINNNDVITNMSGVHQHIENRIELRIHGIDARKNPLPASPLAGGGANSLPCEGEG